MSYYRLLILNTRIGCRTIQVLVKQALIPEPESSERLQRFGTAVGPLEPNSFIEFKSAGQVRTFRFWYHTSTSAAIGVRVTVWIRPPPSRLRMVMSPPLRTTISRA